jgi:hypothetical protein
MPLRFPRDLTRIACLPRKIDRMARCQISVASCPDNSCTRTAIGGRDLLVPSSMEQGWNTTSDGARCYFIPPPPGLWATSEKVSTAPGIRPIVAGIARPTVAAGVVHGMPIVGMRRVLPRVVTEYGVYLLLSPPIVTIVPRRLPASVFDGTSAGGTTPWSAT